MRGLTAVLLLLLACAPAQTRPTPGKGEPAPEGRLPSDPRPLAYSLELRVDPAARTFSGSEKIQLELQQPKRTIWLHARDLRIVRASAKGEGWSYDTTVEQVTPDGVARVSLPREVPAGAVELRFEWQADFSSGIDGLFTSQEGGQAYAATQLESIDARRVFPCFDEPGFKTPFTLSLVVPTRDVAFANTRTESEAQAESGFKRIRFATSAPLPTYLVAIAVGPFDVIEGDLPPNEVRDHPLHVRWAAPKARAGELAFAQQSGDELLVELERYFGIGFPYDKLDHVAVPGSAGAMENAGLIRYAEQILLYKEGESAPQRRRGMASTIAHEMAHQWFGDYVTAPWWDEIWLNEAFASWMAARALDHWKPELGAGIAQAKWSTAAMEEDSLASVRRIREPILGVGDIGNAFDGITYQKGAAVIGMFERLVGDEPFRAGLKRYLAAHAHGSGSTDDLLREWSQAAGRDVAGPFKSFLDQPGVPLITLEPVCDDKGARAELSQARSLPLGSTASRDHRWGVPVCARFEASNGIREACTLLEGEHGQLNLPACPSWIMPNAGGDGYYRWTLAPKDLAALRKAAPNLTVRERLSVAESVRAGLAAGAVPIADALEAARALAQDPDGEVRVAMMGLYSQLIGEFATEEERPRARELAREAYAPLFAELGFGESRDDSEARHRLRQLVVSFLARVAKDPEVRADAARRGRALVAPPPPQMDRAAAPASLAGTALAVAAQEGDAAFFDKLLARLDATEGEEDRARVLGALASATAPELSERVLALSLGKELRANERVRPLYGQLYQVETRDRAWAWLRAHWDQLIAALPGGILSPAAGLAGTVEAFCDEQHAEEARAFFESKVGKVPGARRRLSLALEAAHSCAAQKAAHAEGLVKLLVRRAAAER